MSRLLLSLALLQALKQRLRRVRVGQHLVEVGRRNQELGSIGKFRLGRERRGVRRWMWMLEVVNDSLCCDIVIL